MMQNSRTPLWYICQKKANMHVKSTYAKRTTFRLAVTFYFAVKYQHSWSVWKYAVVFSRLSLRQSPHVQQSNKDHQRPTVSVQCTEWHYSWLLFLIIHILAWLEKKQTVYLFSSPTIWWHWMTEGTLMPVDLAFCVLFGITKTKVSSDRGNLTCPIIVRPTFPSLWFWKHHSQFTKTLSKQVAG